jgi:hypothetical protein
MIKHVVVCDRCKAEADLIKGEEATPFIIPKGWKRQGEVELCPLCGELLNAVVKDFVEKVPQKAV